jgi:hypothetical protein
MIFLVKFYRIGHQVDLLGRLVELHFEAFDLRRKRRGRLALFELGQILQNLLNVLLDL